MRAWVVGFMFDPDARIVVLIRKNRPAWQAGRLNGVGGKIEPGESPVDAMRREFEEEAGVAWAEWDHFVSLTWEEGVVHFFRAFAPPSVLAKCSTMTDESVEMHYVRWLGEDGPGREFVTPNLFWLVPLACHRHDTYAPIEVTEVSTTLRPVRQGA